MLGGGDTRDLELSGGNLVQTGTSIAGIEIRSLNPALKTISEQSCPGEPENVTADMELSEKPSSNEMGLGSAIIAYDPIAVHKFLDRKPDLMSKILDVPVVLFATKSTPEIAKIVLAAFRESHGNSQQSATIISALEAAAGVTNDISQSAAPPSTEVKEVSPSPNHLSTGESPASSSTTATSSDGLVKAWVEVDRASSETDDGQFSLWVSDTAGGNKRRLVTSLHSEDAESNLDGLTDPKFSLDGGYIYFSTDYSAVSSGIHQVSITTGQQRFVTGGALLSIIRSGPYRGFLLIQRHMYYHTVKGGSYNPVYVVSPDLRQQFPVPGSDNEYGERAVPSWLSSNGWIAS